MFCGYKLAVLQEKGFLEFLSDQPFRAHPLARPSLLCFRHFSESRFLLDALHRRSKFANFCHDLMQNHLS